VATPEPPPRDAPEAVARLAAAPRGSPARSELIARLAQQGPEAAAALSAAFPGPIEVTGRGPEIPVEERGPLLAALVALGPVATPYVVDLLRDADPARRRLAALLLGRGADPAGFLPLADAALDVDRGARDGALAALAQQRSHPDFRPVLERLRRSLVTGEGDRRARAARALGALGDEEAIPLLVQALDGAEPVHGAAEAALEALTGASGAGAEGWLGWWRERRGRRQPQG
jgi:HEAT repeat protein